MLHGWNESQGGSPSLTNFSSLGGLTLTPCGEDSVGCVLVLAMEVRGCWAGLKEQVAKTACEVPNGPRVLGHSVPSYAFSTVKRLWAVGLALPLV